MLLSWDCDDNVIVEKSAPFLTGHRNPLKFARLQALSPFLLDNNNLLYVFWLRFQKSKNIEVLKMRLIERSIYLDRIKSKRGTPDIVLLPLMDPKSCMFRFLKTC